MFSQSGKMKAVTFSFDDGITQDIRMVQLLNKYGLKATFNLNSELLGQPRILHTVTGHTVSHYKIEPSEVAEVYRGHEVAAHTLTHQNLVKLEDAEIIRQVEQDRKNLEALVGYDVVGMAYPCGGVNNDDRVAAVLREHTNIRYSRALECTDSFDVQENLYRFRATARILQFDRLREFGQRFAAMQPDKPQIFAVWGHTYELDYDTSYWANVEEFFAFIANRDDIYYGTNREVLLP